MSEVMSKPLNGFCSGILVGLGQNFSSLGGVSGDPGGETLPLRLRLSVSKILTTSQSCYDRAVSDNKDRRRCNGRDSNVIIRKDCSRKSF